MFDEPVRIDSYCHHCKESIGLDIEKGVITNSDQEDVLIYITKPAGQWWNDVVDTCTNHISFLASADHFQALPSEVQNRPNARLSFDQTIEMGRLYFKDRFHIDYERPSHGQIRDLFSSMDLTGDFWKI